MNETIVIIRKCTGKWNGFGGKVQAGETILEGKNKCFLCPVHLIFSSFG